MLRCRDVVRFGDHYLSGDLRGWRRLLFRLHLMLCRDCRRYIRHLVTTRSVSAALPPGHAVAEAELDAVMRQLRLARAEEDGGQKKSGPQAAP
jgi:hypothetical protein